MAIEPMRDTGYRRVGGLYLTSTILVYQCDRLPIPTATCPVCGHGIKFSRGLAKFDPVGMFGKHGPCTCLPDCPICYPKSRTSFTTGIGSRDYETRKSFIDEALELGISKKIFNIPKELKMGQTGIYVVYRVAAQQVNMHLPEPGHSHEATYAIIAYFVPERLDYLVWESKALPGLVNSLKARGITVVPIPDGDNDHAPLIKKKRRVV